VTQTRAVPIDVVVAYGGPEGQATVAVSLPEGATLADAVALSGLVERFGLFAAALAFAIHGQRASASTPLRTGDRVELLRPLRADPREARRRRAEANPLSPARPRGRRHR
jgi:putative ubiquitin-RnfH superfamily antitoxin RatB of RatAB toxin-antitoxin module